MPKNYFLLLLTALLVFVNFFAFIVIIPMYIIDLGGSEFHSGLQNAVFYISAILFRSYFGPMADVRGRKLPLLVGIFAFATAPFLYLLVHNIWGIIAVRIYQAIGLGAFFSTGGSLVGDLAPKGKLGSYMGGYRLINTSAILLGPWLAVSIINNVSYQGWFIVGGLLGTAALITALQIEYPDCTSGDTDRMYAEQTSSTDSLVHKFREVLSVETVKIVFLATAVTAFLLGSLQTFASVYIDNVTDIANPGSYFTLFGIAGIGANLLSGYLGDIRGNQIIAWPFLLLLGLGVAVFSFLPANDIFFVISGLMAGFGFSGAITALFAWLVDISGEELRATALSVQESVIDGSIAIGSFVLGITSGVLGLSTSFLIVGIAVMIVSIWKQVEFGFSN